MIGGISGCRINPPFTPCLFRSGRMGGKDAADYIVSRIGGSVFCACLFCSCRCHLTSSSADNRDLRQRLHGKSVQRTYCWNYTDGSVRACRACRCLRNEWDDRQLCLSGCRPVFDFSSFGRQSLYGCSGKSFPFNRSALFDDVTALSELGVFIVVPLIGSAIDAGVRAIIAPKETESWIS